MGRCTDEYRLSDRSDCRAFRSSRFRPVAQPVGAWGHPVWRLGAHIEFLIDLTALFLYHGIQPYAPDSQAGDVSRRIFIGLAKALCWVGGAMVLISSVRFFLSFERKPREARLLQDLLIGLIYLGTALSAIAHVFIF